MKDKAKYEPESNVSRGKIAKSGHAAMCNGKLVEAPWQSEQKYREIIENANSIIIEMDSKGNITFANEYTQKFFGYSAEEMLGQDVRILVPAVESSGRNLLTMVDEILENPDGFVANINENVLKNGTRVWISWRNKTIRDSRGNVEGNLAVGQDITPLKRAEEALRTSELCFRSLFESGVDGMMITVPDGSILSANPKMCEMLGMTEEEIVHAGREGIVVKDEKLAAGLAERTSTGRFHGELTFRRKDGSLMPAEVSSIFFKDFDGTIKTGQVVRDITEQKQVEQALKQTYDEMESRVEQRTAELKRLADLLDISYDAIVVREEEGKILYWNTGARETYGWSPEEALGQSSHELLRTQFPLPLQEIMGQLKQHGRWEGELIHTHKNGDRIVVLSRWVLRGKGPGTYEILEVNSDISIRKAKEMALGKASAYNRSLIEASLDPLVTIGPDGRITDVNAATEEATGYSREELIGTDFSRYFSDLKKARAGYKLIFKQGFVRDYELAIRHRDGGITPVLYNATVYKDEAGRAVGVFAAARDISESKRTGLEIREKTKALEDLNAALKVLLDHYKSDQRDFEERIMANIDVRINPYLEKLRQTRLDAGQSALLEIIERSLRDISSPFIKGISSEQFRFTPNEIEVISLIKEGRTTKEIAKILHKGVRTVDSCRDNIRRKLGIAHEKVNLRTYLLSTFNTGSKSVN
jgi:PAS domain S-box-containing protein